MVFLRHPYLLLDLVFRGTPKLGVWPSSGATWIQLGETSTVSPSSV
jgi:hypothetical protein